MSNVEILVVEDERIVAKDLQTRLEGLGYNVPAVVFSGEQALKKIAEIQIDLILMDIQLEGEIDGIETTDRIRSTFDIPVIYLTAFADNKTLQRAKITEPYGYIVKPFEERDLISTIEMTLYKHKMEKRLKESEVKFRALFHNANDMIFLIKLGENGSPRHFMEINQLVSQILEYSREELETMTFMDIIDTENQAVERNIAQNLMNGEFVPFECVFVSKSGDKIPVEIKTRFFILGSKEVMLGLARDITKRKEAEEELRKYREHLEDLVEQRTEILQKTNEELLRVQKRLQKQTCELSKRVVELSCLHEITQVTTQFDKSIEDLLQEIVEILPSTCHFPNQIRASIVFEGREYKSIDFQKTSQKLLVDIMVLGRKAGELHVYHLNSKPTDEGEFSKEEERLINTLVLELGKFIEYKITQEALRESEEQLAGMFEWKESQNLLKTASDSKISKDLKLDSLNQSILKELQVNARASMRQLSEELQVPSTTIFNRISRLKEKNVIKGFTTVLDSGITQNTLIICMKLKITKEQDEYYPDLASKMIGEYLIRRFPTILTCGVTDNNIIHILIAVNKDLNVGKLIQQVKKLPDVRLMSVDRIYHLIKGQRLFTIEAVLEKGT
ncbi:MAG: response regulator [Candidatus Hermodarchaeota archaeon]